VFLYLSSELFEQYLLRNEYKYFQWSCTAYLDTYICARKACCNFHPYFLMQSFLLLTARNATHSLVKELTPVSYKSSTIYNLSSLPPLLYPCLILSWSSSKLISISKYFILWWSWDLFPSWFDFNWQDMGLLLKMDFKENYRNRKPWDIKLRSA